MEKVRTFPSVKEKEARRQTAFPDTLCGVVVATGCNIIRRRVASIGGGSVFSSPTGRMEVWPNEDGAVNRTPFWCECLGIKPGRIWKWTPWFWVWGRGGTVREVREARQCLMWCCHSGRSAPLWCRALISGFRSGYCSSNHSCGANKKMWMKKILRMICGREVKQAVRACDVKPGCVQIRMSHFQHYCVCCDSTFVSTNHMEIMLILLVETLFWCSPCFCLKDYKLHCGLKKISNL